MNFIEKAFILGTVFCTIVVIALTAKEFLLALIFVGLMVLLATLVILLFEVTKMLIKYKRIDFKRLKRNLKGFE